MEEVKEFDLVKAQLRIGGKDARTYWIDTIRDQTARCCHSMPRYQGNPKRDFAPDIDTLSLYRQSEGWGIRMDGIVYSGLTIIPFYDSMLEKYTARGSTFEETLARMKSII